MPHFSDAAHYETCAWKFCNTYALRSEMQKFKGKRGWYCSTCTGNPLLLKIFTSKT